MVKCGLTSTVTEPSVIATGGLLNSGPDSNCVGLPVDSAGVRSSPGFEPEKLPNDGVLGSSIEFELPKSWPGKFGRSFPLQTSKFDRENGPILTVEFRRAGSRSWRPGGEPDCGDGAPEGVPIEWADGQVAPFLSSREFWHSLAVCPRERGLLVPPEWSFESVPPTGVGDRSFGGKPISEFRDSLAVCPRARNRLFPLPPEGAGKFCERSAVCPRGSNSVDAARAVCLRTTPSPLRGRRRVSLRFLSYSSSLCS